jgi:hypothetical protein
MFRLLGVKQQPESRRAGADFKLLRLRVMDENCDDVSRGHRLRDSELRATRRQLQ